MTPRARPPARTAGEWWTSYFGADYLREFNPLFTPEQDRREVARLVDLLELPVGARVLDVPCGQGRHAHPLAEAGFRVDGLDFSPHLLALARRRGVSRNLRYTRGDMRVLPGRWEKRFAAVLNLFTSFGFFLHPADDARVIAEFARVLEPGGVLIWHGGSRDGVMAKFLDRDWWRTTQGTLVVQQRHFDPLSGVLTITSSLEGGGETAERQHRIRLYTATRLAELCTAHGLIVEQTFEGFTTRPLSRRSSEMLLVARKES